MRCSLEMAVAVNAVLGVIGQQLSDVLRYYGLLRVFAVSIDMCHNYSSRPILNLFATRLASGKFTYCESLRGVSQ